ncbi:MAG: histidine kinase [Thermosulfidibacteraceae bacterium]
MDNEKDYFEREVVPEEYLELVEAYEEDEIGVGNLTVYLGYAPGVGKTYSMLYDAHLLKEEGVDIVVGYAETHGRPETEALLEGLEVIEPLIFEYKGLKLREVNYRKILERRPQVVIIDELPHTNPPGFPEEKRYQSIKKILEAGIDVYTAMNIQHLESLKDIIYEITGVDVKETVPDPFVKSAKEMKLIDLPPKDLLKRLKEGKVYVKDMAEEARNRFFKVGNLIALRTLSLKILAEQLDERLKEYLRRRGITAPLGFSEKLLVGVYASPFAAQLIRATYRLASELGGVEWIALYVETEDSKNFTDKEKAWLSRAFEVVKRLGGKIEIVKGDDVADEIINYARAHGITKIILGKPRKEGALAKGIHKKLILQTEGIDVYLIAPRGKLEELQVKGKGGILKILSKIFGNS